MGRARGGAARGGCRRRCRRYRRDREGIWAVGAKSGRLSSQARRPRPEAGVGRRRAAEPARLHPYRGPPGVLPAPRFQQRALARDGAFSGTRDLTRSAPQLRGADGGTRQPVPQQPEDDVRRGPHGLAHARPRASWQNARRDAEPVRRDGRRAVRHRPTAPRGARLLREVPGPDPLRQGFLPARGVSVLLARVRNAGRLLRLLPRLPRVLEAVRNRLAGRRSEEDLLQERAEDYAPPAAGRVAEVNRIVSGATRIPINVMGRICCVWMRSATPTATSASIPNATAIMA